MKDTHDHSLAIPLCMLRFIWFDGVEKIVTIQGSLEPITHQEMLAVFKKRENPPDGYWRAPDSKVLGDD
jgi:pyridoxine/pyridoxamine 5'-phosphate oxidase